MTLEVETVIAVSLMMAVFSAVAAVGTSIVLGAGFERLRTGFEVIRKQTGFFSDAIHKLEQRVETVDKQASQFDTAMQQLEAKVGNVGEQANVFCESIQKLEQKVEVVDKQTGFFTDALHRLEKKVETTDQHEEILSGKIRKHSDVDLISTAKTEALVSHAENLLTQMAVLASEMQSKAEASNAKLAELSAYPQSRVDLSIPQNLTHSIYLSEQEGEQVRFH